MSIKAEIIIKDTYPVNHGSGTNYETYDKISIKIEAETTDQAISIIEKLKDIK